MGAVESAASPLRQAAKLTVIVLGLAIFAVCIYRVKLSTVSIEHSKVLSAHQAPGAAADDYQVHAASTEKAQLPSETIEDLQVPSAPTKKPQAPPSGTTKNAQSPAAPVESTHAPPALLENTQSPNASEANYASARIGRGQRLLSVLSCWEKLGNAVISFAQVMRMAELFDFELVLPPLYRSEIGGKLLPDYRSPWTRDLLFETYFDVPGLRKSYDRIASSTNNAGGIWRDSGIDHMLVIDFDDKICQQVTPKLEQHRQESNQTYPIHCIKEPKSILALEELYDSLCSEGARCNLVWYEWRKHLVVPLMSTNYSGLLWSSFNPAISKLAFEMLGEKGSTEEPRYVAVQFRSGAFFRYISRDRPRNEVVDSFKTRAVALRQCLNKLIDTALTAMNYTNATRIYIASDLYGTIPEWFQEADLRKIAFAAFQDARDYIASFASISSTPALNYSSTSVPTYDPHTLSTMLDVQIALNSVELVTVKHSGTYSSLTASAKERLGGRVSLVECERPPL